MPKGRFRRAAAVAIALLVVSCGLSLLVGTQPISAPTAWSALTAYDGSSDHIVIMHSRLPRTVAGIFVGIAFGVAGALIQAFTRNPLADPGILGVNAGAAFAVTIGVALFSTTNPAIYVWFALLGAIAATTAVYAIGSAGGRRVDPLPITLTGVALAAVLTGITTAITIMNKDVFNEMRYWGAGSLTNRGFDVISVAAPLIIGGLLIAAVIARNLDNIALGEEAAASLGTRVQRTRNLAIVAITLLCGAGTAIAGPIGFLGLMVPHVVRWIVGPNNVLVVGFTVLIAPMLLLVSDVLGRVVVTGELQVGIVTAFIGAPVLIYLARKPQAVGL